MSIVLDGDRYEIPGVRTISFADDHRVRQPDYRSERQNPIQFIVLHSTGEDAVQRVTPGSRPVSNLFSWADAVVRASNDRRASWDATLLTNGTLLWHSDPVRFATNHASAMNPKSLGIEIAQGPNDEIYQVQMDALVRIMDFLTEKLGIQREIPWKDGAPDRRAMHRFATDGGMDYVGIVGHRNGATNRGDPGDGAMIALKNAGYEGFDLAELEDKRVWMQRQTSVGIPADGVPGPVTRAAFSAAGHPGGIWVLRGGAGPLVVFGVLAAAGAAGWWLWKRRGRLPR